MVITQSLARMVLPLSTKTSHDCSSNFQCCLFIVMAFSLSHRANRPSITRLPCEQFSSAKNFRSLSEQTTLACDLHCTTLSYDCGIKHLSHDAEADFAFCIIEFQSIFHIIGKRKIANLPRSATSAASYPFEIQNTTLRLSFSLRDTKPCFWTFTHCIAT